MAIIRWLEAHLLACPSKKYLHLECPGCGLQRSIIMLMRGDLAGSISLYPATIPILLLVVFTALHLKYKFSRGGIIIVYLQITIAILIAVFYIYKIINHQIIS